MKRTIIAALASLMLAGVLSAVSAAVPANADGTPIVIGDGAAPVPLLSPQAFTQHESTSDE